MKEKNTPESRRTEDKGRTATKKEKEPNAKSPLRVKSNLKGGGWIIIDK